MSCILEKIYIYILPMFQSINSNHKKQVILLMIWHGAGWRDLAVKKQSVLLIGITSKHKGDF